MESTANTVKTTDSRSPAETYFKSLPDLNELLIPVHLKHAIYFLIVKGSGLEFAHICDGDIVALDTSRNPVRGDIVAAEIDGEFIMGEFTFLEHDFYIRSSTKKIKITEENVTRITGVVRGVLRINDWAR